MSDATKQDSNAIGLDRIGQIAIAIHDLDRAVSFYRDVLKMSFLFQAPPGLAFFDCGGIRLMLTLPDAGSDDHHTSPLYFQVDDISAVAKALEARGVSFERSPHLVAKLPDREVWMAFFRDPDNNLLALMSEIPVS